MKKLIILLTLVISAATASLAQTNVTWEKKNFPDKKKEFADAYKEHKKGEELVFFGTEQYKNALKHLKIAHTFNPDNALTNYYIGRCILFSVNNTESIPYLEKAKKLNPEVAPDIEFELARAHHLNNDWDDAIEHYKNFETYLTTIAGKNNTEVLATQIAIFDKHIVECESGKKLSKQPINVFIDNVGGNINTEYKEYGPVISADNSVMFFTTRRPGVVGSKEYTEADKAKDKEEPFFYEDIMVTHKDYNGNWVPATNLGAPINTKSHEATVSLSPDGQQILYYTDNNNGEILISTLDGEVWSKPKKMPKQMATDYHESSAVFSLDKKTIYFVSNMPEGNVGKGKTDAYNDDLDHITHDIFYCTYNEEKDKWSEPKNLGSHINTIYNERAVFLHPDGKTLFFSSEGHNSIGGLDIFKTVLNEQTNEWSNPTNIGYPVNTADDDVFFVLAADGKIGYYASANPKGKGQHDIYQITFLGEEKEPLVSGEEQLLASIHQPTNNEVTAKVMEITTAQTTILKGVVTDEITKNPIGASIDLMDNEKGIKLATFKSNSTTGKFLVSLPAGKNYGIAVSADDYLFHSENFVIAKDDASKTIEKNVTLKKATVGTSIVLKNIFFDVNKATLRPESINELERLTTLLEVNDISIEIAGHTDAQGSDTYNQQLSEKRAKAVVDYLIKHKIAADRLTYKGYGEAKPLDTNDTAEGRQNNRRTEFTITK